MDADLKLSRLQNISMENRGRRMVELGHGKESRGSSRSRSLLADVLCDT
jgi:hypothetical protein